MRASQGNGSPSTRGVFEPAKTSARNSSQEIAAPYRCTSGSEPALSSPSTFSCARARSQSPITHRSWNRNTRYSALSGALRTSDCSSARASSTRPSRRVCSASTVLPRSLPLRVRGNVPAHLGLGAGRALGVLRGVLHVDLREVERDVLGQPVLTTRPSGRVRGDEDVFELDDQVLERVFARLADGQLRFWNVLAVAGEQHEIRRRHVDVLRERQILDVDLAGARTTAQVGRSRIAHAPAPGEDGDLVLVTLVLRFTFDAVQLQEHIYGHGSSPLAPYRVIVGVAVSPVTRFLPIRARHFPPLADGSLETSRSDTVKPSS